MTAPRRRWFRFSLATLFVVLTVFGCWLGYEMKWIRERHNFLAQQNAIQVDVEGKERSDGEFREIQIGFILPMHSSGTTLWPLWLLGEQRKNEITIVLLAETGDEATNRIENHASDEELIRRAQSLFPEAVIRYDFYCRQPSKASKALKEATEAEPWGDDDDMPLPMASRRTILPVPACTRY